jgi:serine/threonine protein kinase
MATQHWYIRAQGKVTGPFELEALIQKRERGQLLPHHEVSLDGQTWVPATTLDELLSGKVPESAPAPASPEVVPPAPAPPGPDPAAPPPADPEKGEVVHVTLGSSPVTVPGASAVPAPRSLPEQFGHYRILQKHAEGAMGTVWLAQDEKLDRTVALKVPLFTSDDTTRARARFQREAKAAAALRHPNLCPVYEVGEVDGTPYLTMPFLQGKSLSDVGKDYLRRPIRAAASLVRTLALALDEAHRQGVVHRDLKPSNILITTRGEPIIMDFGLARLSAAGDARLTEPGVILGTLSYMAPEQAGGDSKEIGPACDVYALGVILYELLTGRVPFDGPPMVVLGQLMTNEPSRPSLYRPDLDPVLEAICLKAMAKKIDDRYPTMLALDNALEAWLHDTAGQPNLPPGAEKQAEGSADAILDSAVGSSLSPSTAPEPEVRPAPRSPGTASPPTAGSASPRRAKRGTPRKDALYFRRVRGQVSGPFGLADLKDLHQRGLLARFHELSTDRQTWAPASTFAELFPSEEGDSVLKTEPLTVVEPGAPASVDRLPAPERETAGTKFLAGVNLVLLAQCLLTGSGALAGLGGLIGITRESMQTSVICLFLAVMLILAVEILDAAAVGLCTTVRPRLLARGSALAALILAIAVALADLVFLILLLTWKKDLSDIAVPANKVVKLALGVVLLLICFFEAGRYAFALVLFQNVALRLGVAGPARWAIYLGLGRGGLTFLALGGIVDRLLAVSINAVRTSSLFYPILGIALYVLWLAWHAGYVLLLWRIRQAVRQSANATGIPL